jgi:hypothetical protein
MAFLGMRGTGSWVTDQRPKNWREMILKLYPNGMAPLTAILSKMKSKSTDDPEFSWWTKGLPAQRATITGVYTDDGLSVAYVSGGVAGSVLYVKMSLVDVKQFVPGKEVLLRLSTDYRVDCVGKATAVVQNGASSYVKVTLLEADDNGVGKDCSDANVLLIIGSVHAEGADRPDPVSYDVTKVYNYTQIFRNSLAMTRTAQKTKLRTPEAYKEAKAECLELHSIEMEKAFIWGVPSETVGSNGMPERTTMGIIPFVKQYAAANCDDFSLNTSYTADPWVGTGGSGHIWLNTMLEQIFRYGKREKLALCGSGALLGINRIAEEFGQFTLDSTTKDYGLQVVNWVTPFGKINLMTHPLFSFEATNRNSMLIVEPEAFTYRFVDDTTFKADDRQNKGGGTGTDGKEEEFLTEAGLEFDLPEKCAFLNGVGVDNGLSAG